MEYAEDDDPVVATFDVFHADALSQGGSLHLFQYPLRSDSRPYELNSLQMFVTSGELTSGDDPRGGIASSSSQQQTATVGQAAGARVIQPTSRVLLACALDTFPHAESFSSATTTPATGRYNNTSSHHGDSVSASSDIARRQRLLHQLQQQQGDIGGVVKREMDDMDFNSADLEAYQQKQQYAAVPHDGGGAAQANRYRFALHSEPFTPRSEYAVGVFSDGALHLTSIATVQQFTPVVRSQHQQRPSSNTSELGGDAASSGSKRSAAHPSASVAALSREAEGLWVDDEHCSRKPEDCFQAGPIADMVQRQLRRQRSFAVNTDAATIRAVDYFRSSTVESRVIAKRLLAPHTQRSFAGSGVTSSSSNAAAPTAGKTPRVLQHTSSSGNNLFPQEHIVEHGATVRKEFLLRYAHEVPLVSQVRDLMQSSQVMTFDSLMRLLVPPTTTGGAAQAARATSTSVAASAAGAGRIQEDDVLSALRGCAMYIHGRWVAKSNDREFRGNSAAMREVVLLKFWQSADGCVKREDINRLVPNRGSSMVTTIKTILESVAVLVGHRPEDRKWRLKGYAATTTSATTSGSAANEESLVEDTEALAAIKLFEQRYPAESQFQASAWTKRVVPILSHVATLDSGKVCRNLFLVSSSSTTATTSSSGSGQSALGGGGLTPAATSSTSSGNRSASPSKTTTTDPQSDPAVVKVRNYTRRLFIEHGVINKQRAKELIARARQEQFPEASNAALSIAVQLEVQQFTASTWMLKQLHESEVDTFRPFLLAAMMELDNFESRVVVQKATEAYHRRLEEEGRPITDVTSATANIPQRVVQRVLSEAAIYRSAERLWHIKSGNLEQQ